jgi:predicted kinase
VARLIVLAGLPGTGKSTIARGVAQKLGAVWLRIDSMEQALRESGATLGPIGDAGYRAAHAVARDQLRLGRDVIGDSVNPWMLTRTVWRDVGLEAGARVLEVEIVCSDPEQHRHRLETRVNDVPGLILPDWPAVLARDYHPWDRDPVRIDTAHRSVAACVDDVIGALQSLQI